MITYREFRNASAKVERLIQAGEPFVVTKRGKPYFDAVPRRKTATMKRLADKIAAACGGFTISNENLMAGLRASRDR